MFGHQPFGSVYFNTLETQNNNKLNLQFDGNNNMKKSIYDYIEKGVAHEFKDSFISQYSNEIQNGKVKFNSEKNEFYFFDETDDKFFFYIYNFNILKISFKLYAEYVSNEEIFEIYCYKPTDPLFNWNGPTFSLKIEKNGLIS